MRYFYYVIYSFLSKIPTNDTPKTNALILLVALQSLNILTLFTIVNFFLNLQLSRNYAIVEGIVLYIVLLVFNYFYIIRNIKLIIKKYQNASSNKKLIGLFIFYTYVIISITTYFYIIENYINK